MTIARPGALDASRTVSPAALLTQQPRNRNRLCLRPLRPASATQQASTLAGAGPPQQPGRRIRDGNWTRRADAGFRKHEPHIVGRRQVARDCRGDRADLLIAGEQQEGRRAAIALDADRIEAGLRMRELAMAVRRHRAAGMHVRIDQRTERLGAFEPGIEIETQLARQRQIGPLSGGGDDPIDRADPMPCRRAVSPSTMMPPVLFGCSATVAKPVTSVTRPLSTSCRTSAPSSPRAGN